MTVKKISIAEVKRKNFLRELIAVLEEQQRVADEEDGTTNGG